MKLFTKYNRINLLATIIIFLLSSVAFYLALHYILLGQVDDDLKIEQREIETFVKEHNSLPETISVKDQKITYALTKNIITGKKFGTIKQKDSVNNENDFYRTLQFGITVNDKNYLVTVAKSLEATDDLSRSILLISFATILLILTASFLINRTLLKNLWKPFYCSLEGIKNFGVDKKQSLRLPSSPIEEFNFMNQTFEKVAAKAQQEYGLLKEFNENASHEMQTPLAIIRSKLDLLIQDENLSEDQSKIMQSAYDAIEKLSRLNYSLLLLAKIGNNQFADTVPVRLKEKIEQKMEAFHELWQNQNILVSASLQNVEVDLNNELADILLNNLLSNATRHNYPDGRIEINLNQNQLEVSNTGEERELDASEIFSRFFSANKNATYTGLGLSIIKRICDVSALDLKYFFTGARHRFIISWKK